MPASLRLVPLAALAVVSGCGIAVAGLRIDGVVRVVDPANGGETVQLDAGAPLRLPAVAPDAALAVWDVPATR